MDRVTRYPIFSIPHSARITGQALDGDTCYTVELVGVGPEDTNWNPDGPQAWPTDSKAQLDVMKTGSTYSRQVFPAQPSLRTLYLEDEEDRGMEVYHLDASNVLPRQQQDLEKERWVVIQSQAVRKGGTVAPLRGTSDHEDPRSLGQPPSTPLDANSVLPRQQQDLEKEHWVVIQSQAVRKGGTVAPLRGTSDHEDPRSLGQPPSTPLDASSVFPRQQQDLEKERWMVIQSQAVRKGGTVAALQGTSDHRDPRSLGQLPSTPLEDGRIDREQIDFLAARQQFMNLEQANVNTSSQKPLTRAAPTCTPPGASPAPKALSRPPLANGYVVPSEPQVKELVREKKVGSFPTESSVRVVTDPGSWSQVESPEAPKETPIEREIRLAQEREADLREQRGLRHVAGQQELVEIPTRQVLTKVSLAEPPRRDRGRPSLYVQRDMVQETQREEDHRREGLQAARVSTPDWVSEDSQPGLWRSVSSDCILSPGPDARAADPGPEMRKVNRIPPDAYQPYLGPGTPQLEFSAFRAHGKLSGLATEQAKAAASLKAMGSQRQLLESPGKPLSTKQECAKSPGGVVRREHFSLRPLQFRAPEVPQHAEAPHVWGWEEAGAPVLRLQRSHSSDLLDREMESALRREREVAEERRNALFPEVFSPTPAEGCEPGSRSSSGASGITGSYSVSESSSFTPAHLHSGLVWKVEARENDAAGQKKKELWYAGINPTDSVNSEILGATRVTRHKNALAERWEAGIYATDGED